MCAETARTSSGEIGTFPSAIEFGKDGELQLTLNRDESRSTVVQVDAEIVHVARDIGSEYM